MFGWLRGRKSSQPVSAQQVPAEVHRYLSALQPFMEYPFVREHFHQVTWLSTSGAESSAGNLYVLEFRAGSHASLVWMNAAGQWCVGQYVPLAHAEADVTCAPSGISPDYWAQCMVLPSLEQAVLFLEAATPAQFRKV